jgi:hypothetical protein
MAAHRQDLMAVDTHQQLSPFVHTVTMPQGGLLIDDGVGLGRTTPDWTPLEGGRPCLAAAPVVAARRGTSGCG